MSTPRDPNTLTEAEASALVGDDIAYWMGNPFMTGEMRVGKVLFWLNAAILADRAASTGQDDELRAAVSDLANLTISDSAFRNAVVNLLDAAPAPTEDQGEVVEP